MTQPVHIPDAIAEEFVADSETRDLESDLEDDAELEGTYVEVSGREVVEEELSTRVDMVDGGGGRCTRESPGESVDEERDEGCELSTLVPDEAAL